MRKEKDHMSMLPGVETRVFHSSLLDQDLRLFIKLPWTYETGDKTYPVLYVLDANRSFPIYSTTSLILETPGTNVQETILVGIGYQLDGERIHSLAQWGQWRTRDLTPVRREQVEEFWNSVFTSQLHEVDIKTQTGGGPQFLRCIQEEIIPFIETQYRVDAGDRGLAGYSYGGLFVLYALFQAPATFKRYFAGSPSMWTVLFELEESYAATHKDLDASLFLSLGECEDELRPPFLRMEEILQSRGYPGLKMQSHIFEGVGHVSASAAAISRALEVLYYPELITH
jgi:predicted alpha/beta superfamily hydrolase